MNVETACVCLKGQGTVRKYLVGTTDRWNNAKKAEEKEIYVNYFSLILFILVKIMFIIQYNEL